MPRPRSMWTEVSSFLPFRQQHADRLTPPRHTWSDRQVEGSSNGMVTHSKPMSSRFCKPRNLSWHEAPPYSLVCPQEGYSRNGETAMAEDDALGPDWDGMPPRWTSSEGDQTRR
jgi:hypothetical protein